MNLQYVKVPMHLQRLRVNLIDTPFQECDNEAIYSQENLNGVWEVQSDNSTEEAVGRVLKPECPIVYSPRQTMPLVLVTTARGSTTAVRRCWP
jgi:hypothetical protein